MGELHELISTAAVGRLFMVLAIAGPIVGAIAGTVIGTLRRKNNRHNLTYLGFLWGLSFTVNWLLWKIYNFLTDRNGLDSVRNLALNLILFIIVGIVIGVIAARLYLRSSSVTMAGQCNPGGTDTETVINP